MFHLRILRVLREAYAFPLTSVVLHKWESNGLSTFDLREGNYLRTIDLKNFHDLKEQNDLSAIGLREVNEKVFLVYGKQCYDYHLLNGKLTPLAYGNVVRVNAFKMAYGNVVRVDAFGLWECSESRRRWLIGM